MSSPDYSLDKQSINSNKTNILWKNYVPLVKDQRTTVPMFNAFKQLDGNLHHTLRGLSKNYLNLVYKMAVNLINDDIIPQSEKLVQCYRKTDK